jgi:uncharacterized protein YbjT (DUF2867 family)
VGCEAVIHLVGIIREFPGKKITFKRMHFEATRNMVEAAEAQGVNRYLQMSANGTRENAKSPYHQTKWQAEEAVRSSSLEWTIFRPSLIFGPKDEFVNMLAEMIRKLPVLPVIGDGKYRMSPVAVEDVAASFVKALTLPGTVGKIFHCCGPQSYSYDELLDLIGAALGKAHVPKLHHPVFLMKPAVALLESFPAFPLTSSQMTMLLEGNECDPKDWAGALGITPKAFPEGIRRYLNSLMVIPGSNMQGQLMNCPYPRTASSRFSSTSMRSRNSAAFSNSRSPAACSISFFTRAISRFSSRGLR